MSTSKPPKTIETSYGLLLQTALKMLKTVEDEHGGIRVHLRHDHIKLLNQLEVKDKQTEPKIDKT